MSIEGTTSRTCGYACFKTHGIAFSVRVTGSSQAYTRLCKTVINALEQLVVSGMVVVIYKPEVFITHTWTCGQPYKLLHLCNTEFEVFQANKTMLEKKLLKEEKKVKGTSSVVIAGNLMW